MQQREFLEIVMPMRDRLYRMAKRLLVSVEEAEDATQDVLMRLWDQRERMKEYRNVEAFAMTMTKNHCLDRIKSKSANNLRLVHNNYENRDSSLYKQVEAKDSLGWVGKIIDKLPEQQRMVLQLRDVEELEYSEIAQMLEMNETAVRVTLSRARKTIREKLTNTHNYGIS